MAKQMPQGWISTTLGDVCLPVEKIRPEDSPDTEFTYFDIGGIDSDKNIISETKTILGRNAPSRARQLVRTGDILFSTVRTYLRKIARIEQEYPNPVASTGFAVLRCAEDVSAEFILFQILTEEFLQRLDQLQTGTSYPAVRERDVFAQTIVLPPAREQKRIVKKLKAALTPIEKAVSLTEKSKKRITNYRATVLNQALTGELTREWREARTKGSTQTETGESFLHSQLVKRRLRWGRAEGERRRTKGKSAKDDAWKSKYPEPMGPETTGLPKLPEEWVWASAQQLTDATRPISYGVIKLGADVKQGVPILRSSNVRHLRLELDQVKRIQKEIAEEYQRTFLKGQEVLITIRGTLGGVVSVPKKCAGYNISREVAMLALLEPKTSSAVAYFIGSDILQHWLQKHTRGIAYTGVNIESVKALPIPVPSLAEQTKITIDVNQRLKAADKLELALEKQSKRATVARRALLRQAFRGDLTTQDPTDEPAIDLIERIRVQKANAMAAQKKTRQITQKTKRKATQDQLPSPESIRAAWNKMGKRLNAQRLFEEAETAPEHVVQFYEALRATPEVRTAFQNVTQMSKARRKPSKQTDKKHEPVKGRFRLIDIWLQDFKNLRDYTVLFNPTQGLDVVLGWNGTGKSNLFEALVIILRDLHNWWEKNRWPDKPMSGFRLKYQIDEDIVEVHWLPDQMKRPQLRKGRFVGGTDGADLQPIKREQLLLPKFVFGYYSGPTNRLAEHFLPMKQAHYDRLLRAKADNAETLAQLLEQRRFFCAETHHAKYVLLAFSYKEDRKIEAFLRDRLRILGFESALFVIRKPRWAKPGAKPEDFWGATGIMLRVMQRLRNHAIAPIVLRQKVSYGYRSTTEDHYYFFLPDVESLHAFAAEYENARTFFLALESTDFSELIYDVKIQVRIKANETERVAITFHQLSEGEQQLLMVLGLMRFTKSHGSLVLLDEPDTHLNPHWSIDYLKDLARVMSDNALESPEQQTSQILMASHDPLVIASLIKEQIHLLKRDRQTGMCKWVPASVNPRGLGFTGILTSEMFGFRSDLDPETLSDLDNKVRLVAKEDLTDLEKRELEQIDRRLADVGFSKAFSDPYYAAFVRAWGRRHAELMAGKQFLTIEETQEIDRIARDVLDEAVTEVERELTT